MKNLLGRLFVALLLAASAFAANASVVATVNLGGGDPYWDDYDVFFGLGSTSSPDWSQRVAWAHNPGDGFAGSASLDITTQYNVLGGQTWWVLVDDNWGWNASNLVSFSINTGSVVHLSPDAPIYIPDNGYAYAYITTPRDEGTVPEPATLALSGLALTGLALLRRRQKSMA